MQDLLRGVVVIGSHLQLDAADRQRVGRYAAHVFIGELAFDARRVEPRLREQRFHVPQETCDCNPLLIHLPQSRPAKDWRANRIAGRL